jgi:hypothetical protein
MATVLDERTIEKQRSLVCVVWAKRLIAKYVHKEIIPVYGGRVPSICLVP